LYLKIKIPCAVVERLGIHSLFNFRRAEKGKKGEGGGVVCVCDVERKEKKKKRYNNNNRRRGCLVVLYIFTLL
jgi:hypothetical protein